MLRAAREIIVRGSLKLKRISVGSIDHTILLSNGDRELFLETFGQAHAQRSSVVFNGIDVNRFALGKKLDLGLPKESAVVLTVADLNNQKGHRFLIEAIPDVLREFPTAQFVLVGEGHIRPLLENLVREKGVARHVLFLGRREDVPDLLATAQLVVLPSLFEGLPLVLLEAMAAGKAVVATNVSGSKDVVVHGETGLLVEPANPHALSAAILHLLRSDAVRTQMEIRARERARNLFTVERMCEKTLEVYRSVLT